MKKLSKAISIMCIAALVLCMPLIPSSIKANAASVASTADGAIRVHLKTLDGKTSIPMYATGKHTIEDNGVAIAGDFTVKNVNGKIQIISGSNTYNLDGDVLISSETMNVSNLVLINSTYRYAGDLRLIANGSTIKIVNHLDYETYLLGVIPYEMNDSWPIEALKAQAVAARTFAYYSANSNGNRTSRQHDVTDTTSSQVYRGYNGSYTNSIAAINATAKQVLETNSGGYVFACYSASNGGYTEYGDLSGASYSRLDYLPYKKDDADLKFILANSSYSAKVTIPKTLPIASLRSSAAEPYKMIRDKLISKGYNPANISGDVTVKNIELTHPDYVDHSFTGAKFTLGVPKVGDVVIEFLPYKAAGSNSNWPFLNEILMPSNKTMFYMLHLSSDSSSYLLASVRYGHGSGMSQVGAYQMAKDGKTYQDILAFYYESGNKTKLVTKNWNIGDKITTPEMVEMNKTGKVSDGPLNVRSGAGSNYSIIAELKTGTAVTITACDGSWYKIKHGSGVGYVSALYVTLDPDKTDSGTTSPTDPETSKPDVPEITDPGADPGTSPEATNPSTPDTEKPEATTPPTDDAPKPDTTKPVTTTMNRTGKVSDGPLNVRGGAGTNYAILGTLNIGNSVTISATDGTWYTIKHGKNVGYVMAQYITLNPESTTPSTPSTDTPSTQATGSVESKDNKSAVGAGTSSSAKASSGTATKSTSSDTTVKPGNTDNNVGNGAQIASSGSSSIKPERTLVYQKKAAVYTMSNAPGKWRVFKSIFCHFMDAYQESEQSA